MIHDPGHAWLEVDLNDLVANDIYKQVSNSSYYLVEKNITYNSKGYQNVQYLTRVYLEEDCDAPLYLNELKRIGEEYKLVDVFYDNDCYIRRLKHWVKDRATV
jgi:hypothetical protein